MNTGRDNHLWRDSDTDFHQQAVNQLLTRFWQRPQHGRGSRVFVPLCGKSLDMIWLAQRGYEVIGVELSPIAVRAFFLELGNRVLGFFTKHAVYRPGLKA
jgi:thiopurine S-methyltransferase